MKSIISKILKYFTLNKMVKNKEIKTLLINIAIYIGIGIALGIYKAIVGKIPLLGNLSYNVAGLYRIYAWVGAILAAIQCFGNDDYSDVEYVTLEDIKNLWNLKNGKIAIIVAAVVLCLIPNINRALTVGSNDKKEDKVASSEVKEMEEEKQEEYSNKEAEENDISYEEEYVEETANEISSDYYEYIALKYDLGDFIGRIEEGIDGVIYDIYENGASYVIDSDEYSVKEEVEYEGKIYPVTDFGGCWQYRYYECEEFTVPEHIKTISSMARVRAKNIIIPDTVELIHLDFYESEYETLVLPENAIYGNVYYHSFLGKNIPFIPEGIEILDRTFYECKYLESVALPSTITEIKESSFEGCRNLTEITLPENVKVIEHYAFKDCSSLKSINLPEGMTELSLYAFENCVSLEEIIIPEGLEVFLGGFYNMPSLKTVVFPKEGEYSVDVFVESNSPVETIYLPDSTTVDRISSEFPNTLKTLYVAEDKVSEFQAAYPDVEVLVRE